MGKVGTEETLQNILHTARVIEASVSGIIEDFNDYDEILALIKRDGAKEMLPVGSQLVTKWGTYDDPFDIVNHGTARIEGDDEDLPALFLQQHFANVVACPFDPQEALYDADNGLSPNTYTFEVAGDTWLTTENGKIMQFTLTKAIPVGGQIVYADTEGYNKAIGGQKLRTYSSADSFTVIEEVTISEVSSVGANHLGKTDGLANLNHHQRAYRGSGRWKTSMLRQYLNSADEKGKWWKKQAKWDRASTFINSNDGYMKNFPSDFMKAIKAVKVQTARNTVNEDGGTDITYDKFFPIGLEQLNAVSQIYGVEGEPFEYWKAVADDTDSECLSNGKFKQYVDIPNLKTYALNSQTTARYCWLRSAHRGGTGNAWRVTTSGNVGYGNALSGNYCAPACVIC